MIAAAHPHRPGGPIERGEEPITGDVDLPAAVVAQASADPLVMRPLQVPPSGVSRLDRPLGGLDDVGEHDGGQHPVGHRGWPGAGQELLHLN
jgi:hypothetical protein